MMTDRTRAARLIAELARENGQDPRAFVQDFQRKLSRRRPSASLEKYQTAQETKRQAA